MRILFPTNKTIPRFRGKIHYSFFSASAGLVRAARRVCQRTARREMTKERAVARTTYQPQPGMVARSNQDCSITSHTVTGTATILAIKVIFKNDQRVRRVSESIVPPNTFLTAVS